MLAEKYRVVAMSTRGTDMSDKPAGYDSYAAERVSEDISALIEHFGGGPGRRSSGRTAGGLYAWHFAMTRPAQTERLISLGTVHPGGLLRELRDNPAQQQANLFQRNMQVYPQAGADFGAGVRAAPRDPDEPANLAQLRKEAAACLDTDSVVGFYKTNWPDGAHDPGDRVGRVQARRSSRPSWRPRCSSTGRAGRSFLNPAVNGMWDWVDGPLTIHVLPGVGHGPHREIPEFVTPRIMEWLETGR